MINLQAYRNDLTAKIGKKAAFLDKTIEFINLTSQLIETFQDSRPITSLSDSRIALNQEMFLWLQEWENDAASHQELRKTDQSKRLLSAKLRYKKSKMSISNVLYKSYHFFLKIYFYKTFDNATTHKPFSRLWHLSLKIIKRYLSCFIFQIWS